VASINPTSGPVTGGTLVTITGSGFSTVPGSIQVAFAGFSTWQDATCTSTTSCTVISPAQPPGNVDVLVRNPLATSSPTLSDRFTYLTAIAASPSPITAGNDLSVTVSGIGAPTGGDWIALRPDCYHDRSYIACRFTGGIASGTLT